jgi:hypothetical protein
MGRRTADMASLQPDDDRDLTDIEEFEKTEREGATKKRPARTWDQFVDETAKDFPDMTRLEVERSLKRLMARGRHMNEEVEDDED